MKRIKTINSHSGLARWLSELDEEPMGYLARVQVAHIPSPYHYSPCLEINSWNGKPVVWFETRHKHYEVYALEPEMLRFKTDEDATEYHISNKTV